MQSRFNTQKLLAAVKNGVYAERVGSIPPGQRLVEMRDSTLVKIADHNRGLLSTVDQSDERREITLIVQSLAESKGYEFDCRCGRNGIHRAGKKVFCRICVKAVINDNIERRCRSHA